MIQTDFDYVDVKLEVFKQDDNRDFCLVQNFTVGETDFNPFIRLRNQLVIAADMFGREENLAPLLIPTMFKDKDEQLKLAHKEKIEVVGRANRKICVTLLS